MGLFGIALGTVKIVRGIINDDDEMIKSGATRVAVSTVTTILGDVAGVSDGLAEASGTYDA